MAFRRSEALYRGFVGGRGAGKTWVGAYDLIRRARPGSTYLIASPTGVLMQDTTWPAFREIARGLDRFDPGQVRLSPYPTVRLTTGATVRFRTAEKPERLRGPNLSGVWLDEASLMDREAYLVCIASLREAGAQGWLSATFTPRGFGHWTYEVFGQPRPDTETVHARTRDNPFLPAGFQQTLARQYSGLLARQELEGAFCALEGAEWPPEFFERVFFTDWPPDLVHKVLSLDPSKGKQDRSGDYSAFVLLGLCRDGCLWADADLDAARPVESPRGNRSLVNDGLDLVQSWRPDAFSVETNGFQHLVAEALLRVAGERRVALPLYGVCSTSPKVSRIRALGPFLAQGRLRVRDTPGGRLLCQQLRDFPEGEHDDAPDALAQAVRMLDRVLGQRGGADVPELVRGT